MLVKSVSTNVKDIWIGTGWTNWIRIDLAEKRILKSNCTIKPALLKTILGKVHK